MALPEREEPPPPSPLDVPLGINGTYTVEPGNAVTLKLDIPKGFQLVGRLTETSGREFGYSIFSERNLVKWNQGKNSGVEDDGADEPAHHVVWEARSDGPFFLVLDAEGKVNDREVVVDLRRRPTG